MKFSSNKQQDEDTSANKVTVLSLGFELTGDIISKSDIRADGILVGSIRTDKKVVVGEKATITGDIIAEEISISGEVVGDLFINGETTIYSTAKVSGNIITNQIFIHKGADINSSIRTADAGLVQSLSKSSKVNSVSRDELYSLLDSEREKAPEKKIEEKEPSKPGNKISESETEESNKNFPRLW